MSAGIRAEIRLDPASDCPMAQVSAATGESSYAVSKSVDPNAPNRVTEEFMLDADTSAEELDVTGRDLTEVFSYGSKSVYRISRTGGQGCPCECVEQFDSPVIDVHSREGALFLSFHARDIRRLQEIVTVLGERYQNLKVRRLVRSRPDRNEQSLVFVDRSELTDRQQEVLRTAHEMGYFEHPKGANAGEIAGVLGITTSTFTEHLSTAQRKLLGAILAD